MAAHKIDMEQYAEEKAEYDDYEAVHKASVEAAGKVYAEVVANRPSVPPTPVRHAAETMLRGPLNTCEAVDQVTVWNSQTRANIIAASDMEFAAVPSDAPPARRTMTEIKNVKRVIKRDYETADPCLETRVLIDLMHGIVRKDNAAWIDAGDLDKIALAHGSKATERTEQLRDIYASQRLLLEEIVANGYNFADEARGFCIAHALLERS